MDFSVILNYVLGGGLLAAMVGIVTLKATIRKAEAEADKAKAEAETVRIDNAEHATRILMENIVQPLKKELNETRELLQETRQELEATKKFLASLEGKLSNEKFVSRAPEAVVNAEREKAAKQADLISQLEQSLAAMEKMA